MSLEAILTYTQLGAAVVLIVTILLQQRGSGLGGALGGGSSMEFSTKRGVEKGIFYASIVVAVIFIATSVARLVLPS